MLDIIIPALHFLSLLLFQNLFLLAQERDLLTLFPALQALTKSVLFSCLSKAQHILEEIRVPHLFNCQKYLLKRRLVLF